jgi:phi13 family phage major tail protein
MPNSGEYKSVVGLDEVHVALVTQDDSSGYVADTPEDFAPAIEATAEPSTSQDTQYADNQPFDVLTAEGETKVTLTTTNIPIQVLAKYLGKAFDTVSGRMFDTGADATPPDAALSFRSMKSNGSYRYVQYLKGKFSVPKDEAATVAEKKDPKPSQIVFTAVNTIYKFDVGLAENKSVKRIIGDEDSLNFVGTTWFSQVQTPSIVAPSALALSSSVPTDGASGISVSANQTLTFNNALKDSAINGITLVKSTDGSMVASAISLDATKKIFTVDPNANLTAATKYYLVYAVEDIHGQTLNGAVDFTTA